jgi:tripartite-type tricarboxylate transporter receptor subunit TctC
MKRPRRQFLRLSAAAAALTVISVFVLAVSNPDAWSQTTRTIKVVVPFPPGGAADTLARLLAEEIGRAGPTVVIENRPGGGAAIAYEAVARAAPDGNTLVINGNSLVINPHFRKVNYDPLTSFEPVCHLVNSPNLIVVNSSSPYRTLDDYLAAARSKPGELVFAAVGPATAQHIGFEQFVRLAGINVTFVPYQGGAPAVTAVLGGHVSAALANYSEAMEQLNVGNLRALVSLSRERIAALPDVPSTTDVGFKDYSMEVWFGALAPVKTPKDMVTELATWIKAAIQAPGVKPRLAALGLYPIGTCLDDFAAYIRKQHDEYGRIIHEANIKPR